MVRGFVDMELPPEAPDGSNALQAGLVSRLESVIAMRQPWRVLADRSDLPTTQFEWAVAGMNQLAPTHKAHIAYVNDGSNIRAVLPLLVRPRRGVEHFQFMTPAIPMPIDIPHAGRDALLLLLSSVSRLGRPIYLNGMLADSPAAKVLREMASDHRGRVQIEDAQPINYLPVPGFALQDRIQSAARVSIIATSYGLSGGPNDVIFQFVAPSLDQVMHLFHESLQLHAPTGAKGGKKTKARKDIDMLEFMRTYAFNCAQRGEIRFSCLRLAGRLLAVQMLQVRKNTAWLLTAGNLERFRDTTLGTLLMGETIRKLQQESVERLVLPSAPNLKELGECKHIPCIDVTVYPLSSRSLIAKVMHGAGRVSGLLRRRRGENGSVK